MATDPKVTRLREVDLFSHCSDKELAALAEAFEEVTFPEGKVICRQGRLDWQCVVVGEGSAEVVVDGQAVGSVGPGEAIGEIALLTREPRTATVTTKTPMTAYVVEGRRFEAMLEAMPNVAVLLSRTLAQRLQRLYVAAGRPQAG